MTTLRAPSTIAHRAASFWQAFTGQRSSADALRAMCTIAAASLLTVFGAWAPVYAQNADRDPSPHSELALVSELSAAAPGTRVTIAIRVTIDSGWHTYWTNPGDAGLPLTARWTVPAGFTVSPLQFPTPHLLPQPPLMSYGYEHEVLVLADVDVPTTAPLGKSVSISAAVDWLVCAEVCLPANGVATLDLPVRAASSVSATKWSSSVQMARDRFVRSAAMWRVQAAATDSGYVIRAVVGPNDGALLRAPHFLADSVGIIEHAAAQRVRVVGDTIQMHIARSAFSDTVVARLQGVIVGDAGTGTPGWKIDVPLENSTALSALATTLRSTASDVSNTGGANMTVTARAITPVQNGSDDANTPGLLLALGAALLGGLILNLMPCVFPVLSVKILAFVEQGGHTSADPTSTGSTSRASHSGRNHALVFTLGVLVTFWLLAGALFALRAGGEQLGWGFQLQSPWVVTVLAMVMFALALNLSGLFTIGAGLTRLGAVGGGNRYVDSFLTGALAVVVATPCTAPFMGAALGYALTQQAIVGLAVFTALGIGLALPYVVFASSPSLLRLLPKPGPWLETLKQLLAFPMYATVVWLLWVLGQQTGVNTLALVLMFSIVIAMIGWAAGRAQLAGHARRGAVVLAFGVVAIAASGLFVARSPLAAAPAIVATSGASAAGLTWEPYSADIVNAARREGQMVFIDFTAAWCLSCQVNERVALHTAAVEKAFGAHNVRLLRADWTSRDPAITAALESFGRSGVPLYALYPARPDAAAELLPAVLTPGIVIDAITRAATVSVSAR